MANVLDRERQQQILALGRLEWSLRQIEEATGVRRETASRYLGAAGVAVRPLGRWGHLHARGGTPGCWRNRTFLSGYYNPGPRTPGDDKYPGGCRLEGP